MAIPRAGGGPFRAPIRPRPATCSPARIPITLCNRRLEAMGGVPIDW